MTRKTFPKLFRKTARGADHQWEISVAGRTITTRWGQIGGLLQTTSEIIAKVKCLGRVNATTPEEHAVLEAKSRWELKQKKDYTLSLADARAGKASALVEGGVLPMLAHRFDEYGEKLAYPCFAQPKLDGHRCRVAGDGRHRTPRRTIQPRLPGQVRDTHPFHPDGRTDRGSGGRAVLRKFLEHPKRYVGRMLTEQYHGLTAKSKVPRFPVALRVRADV